MYLPVISSRPRFASMIYGLINKMRLQLWRHRFGEKNFENLSNLSPIQAIDAKPNWIKR